MENDDAATSVSGTGTPVVGIRSDVYERRWELLWMSKDDIEHFEARLADKTLFQNLAIICLSGSIPLLIEKAMDYNRSNEPTDMAIVLICIAAAVAGVGFQIVATLRRKKLQTFKQQLFQRERKLSSTFQMIDTSSSSSSPRHDVIGVA